MRTLVFLLVLANLFFYAWKEGHFGRPDNPDAHRLQTEVRADSLRIVSRGEPPAKAAAPASNREAGGKPGSDEKEASTGEIPRACIAWEKLATRDADRLAQLLSERFPDFGLDRKTQAGEGSAWWVYIPPLTSKAEAEKKTSELKRLGVSDYFVIQEAGAQHLAISLGVFSSEARATERLAELRTKGVRSARSSPRPGKETLISLEARGPQTQEAALLESVAAAQPEAQSRPCP